MKKRMIHALLLGLAISCLQVHQTILSAADETAVDEDDSRRLFDFGDSDSARQWQTVNDGVMGGRSDGRFRITDEGKLEFFGNLSLANNGGFASVRSRSTDLNLQQGDVIVAKVRGDGRKYSFNLYVPTRQTAFSYRISFDTIEDEWVEVRMPLDRFVATSFGRTIPNEKVDPDDVTGLGILLGDKRAGPFKLEVDWIEVRSADE